MITKEASKRMAHTAQHTNRTTFWLSSLQFVPRTNFFSFVFIIVVVFFRRLSFILSSFICLSGSFRVLCVIGVCMVQYYYFFVESFIFILFLRHKVEHDFYGFSFSLCLSFHARKDNAVLLAYSIAHRKRELEHHAQTCKFG